MISNQQSVSRSNTSKYAFVTAVFGNKGYIIPAISLAKSLRRVTDKYLVCIYYGLDNNDIYVLGQYFDELVQTSANFDPNSIVIEGENSIKPSVISGDGKYISLPNYLSPQDQTGKDKNYLWRVVITRWTALNLTNYDKIILLDADTYFFQSVDDLFNLEPPAIVIDHRKDNTLVNENNYKQFYKYDQKIKTSYSRNNKFSKTNIGNLIRNVNSIPQNAFKYLKSIHYGVLGCEGSMILLRPNRDLFKMMLYSIQGTIWDFRTYGSLITSASRPDEIIPLIGLAELGLEFKTIPFNYMVQNTLYDKLNEKDRSIVKAVHMNDLKPWFSGKYQEKFEDKRKNEIRRSVIDRWMSDFPQGWENYIVNEPVYLS